MLAQGVLVNENPYPGAWRVREAHFPPQIAFTRPRRTAAISLTGDWCALDCAHCGKRYLRGMMPVELADVSKATSCLISGGCDSHGRVPIRPHLDEIRSLGAGRRLNWHVGLIPESELEEIASLVDVVSFDMVGDDETIRETYGLSSTVDDYVQTYRMLRRHVPVVPHITIGLRGGRISGERRAISLLKSLGLEALVFIVLIPTKGTRYEHCAPPKPAQVGEIIAHGRRELPDTPIYLGCMRPAGRYRDALDGMAVQAGANKIVNPSPLAVGLAQEMGLRVVWEDECCVFQGQGGGSES